MLIFSLLCTACNAATCSGDGVLVQGQHQGDKSISDTHRQEYLFCHIILFKKHLPIYFNYYMSFVGRCETLFTLVASLPTLVASLPTLVASLPTLVASLPDFLFACGSLMPCWKTLCRWGLTSLQQGITLASGNPSLAALCSSSVELTRTKTNLTS
jgi:hypothetical protein